MPTDDIFISHLKRLAEKSSWRLSESPSEVGEEVLRVMDNRGWVEFQIRHRQEPYPRPFKDVDPSRLDFQPDENCGWFSPQRKPRTAGELSQALAWDRDDPEVALWIRVSEAGKAALAEANVVGSTSERAGAGPDSVDALGMEAAAGGDSRSTKSNGQVAVAKPRHGPDFRSVVWRGDEYNLTATQAACVRMLWQAWENGTPDVADATLLEMTDARTSRLVDIFRGCPAWGTMIIPGKTKGTRRLSNHSC